MKRSRLLEAFETRRAVLRLRALKVVRIAKYGDRRQGAHGPATWLHVVAGEVRVETLVPRASKPVDWLRGVGVAAAAPLQVETVEA